MKEPSVFDAPKFLIISTTFATFTFLTMIFYVNVPDAISNVLFTMIGIVLGKWATILEYFFGSSSGSKAKSDVINEMSGSGTGDGTGKTKSKTEITKTITSEDPAPKETPPAIAAWISGAAYKVGDVVLVGTSKYRALTDHTSAAEDEPGTGTSWTAAWERQA